jgi:GAF domain
VSCGTASLGDLFAGLGGMAALALLYLSTGHPDSFADDVDGRAAYQMQVHQATGMVKVQAGVTIEEAFLMLRARPFATDLAADHARWPLFVPAAVAAGFRSVAALPLRLRDHTIGGLNLFHDGAGPVPAADQRLAQALADVATIGILQQRSAHRSARLARPTPGLDDDVSQGAGMLTALSTPASRGRFRIAGTRAAGHLRARWMFPRRPARTGRVAAGPAPGLRCLV